MKYIENWQILLLLFILVDFASGMTYIGYVLIFAYIAAIIIQESSIVTMNPCILVRNASNFILIRKGTDSQEVKIDFSSL